MPTPSQRENARQHHHRRRQGLNGGAVKRIKRLLYERDQGVCQSCRILTSYDAYTLVSRRGVGTVKKLGAAYPTIQHVVPLSDGGTWNMSNLSLWCHACNQRDNRQRMTR